MVVLGPVGVGKTFLASALGHLCCRAAFNVRFHRAAELLRLLKQSRMDNSRDALMTQLATVDVLVIDDFALEPMTREESRDIYQLFVERNARCSTVVTSNRDTAEWIAAFDDALLAQSAVDRFKNLHLDGARGRGAVAAEQRLRPGRGRRVVSGSPQAERGDTRTSAFGSGEEAARQSTAQTPAQASRVASPQPRRLRRLGLASDADLWHQILRSSMPVTWPHGPGETWPHRASTSNGLWGTIRPARAGGSLQRLFDSVYMARTNRCYPTGLRSRRTALSGGSLGRREHEQHLRLFPGPGGSALTASRPSMVGAALGSEGTAQPLSAPEGKLEATEKRSPASLRMTSPPVARECRPRCPSSGTAFAALVPARSGPLLNGRTTACAPGRRAQGKMIGAFRLPQNALSS